MNQQQIREQLIGKRNELLGRLQQLSGSVAHRREPLPASFSEQAIELENLDVLFGLDEASRHELQCINVALERLDSNEYEICTLCANPIGTERLRAVPYTDVCIECAGKNFDEK